jgi:hypothetical protein
MNPTEIYKELIDICQALEISVRINSNTGAINLYEELGEFECAEQAVRYLTNLRKRVGEEVQE